MGYSLQILKHQKDHQATKPTNINGGHQDLQEIHQEIHQKSNNHWTVREQDKLDGSTMALQHIMFKIEIYSHFLSWFLRILAYMK